ncbi:PREDICTED: excitatory amino acid transporter 3-like [Poecilia mexicana]|uniref:excitatory amino acid transporter 3-like n=1 Tax=Poecilia mexicana TaxID=48701 RepID=UPI00072DA5BD|nr:PREDICTED: excitatory amino acid transporter 3-like [Poecilia mexicana]
MGEQSSAKSFGIWEGIVCYISSNLLVFTCLGAVALGIVIGVIVKTFDKLLQAEELYLTFPIDVLSHMIKGVSIPLIASSVVLGIRTFKTSPSKTIAVYTGLYFLSTTLIAVIIGLTLMWAVQTGFKVQDMDDKKFFSIETFLVLYRNIFPDSMMRSFVKHYRLEKREFSIPGVATNAGIIENKTGMELEGRYDYGVDVLGLLFISFMSGLAFNEMEESRVIVRLICTISQITDDFFNLIRSYLPVGVLFMSIFQVSRTNDWIIALDLIKFTGLVLFGLFLHGAIILPLIYLVLAQSNPFTVIRGVLPALRTALLLSSSAATMPVTLHCCKNNNIHNKITRFMLPIGTNINMNGTALYQAAAAVFIAQVHHVYLDFNLLFSIGCIRNMFGITKCFLLLSRALCLFRAQDWQAAVEEYEEVQTHWNAYTSAS